MWIIAVFPHVAMIVIVIGCYLKIVTVFAVVLVQTVLINKGFSQNDVKHYVIYDA